MEAVTDKSMGENDGFWEANPKGVPIAALFGTQGGSGEVGTQIRKADADADGYLNKSEFRHAIAETLRQARENKGLKGAVIALVISVVVLTATVCGGVYGIVESAKDTESHDSDAALYVKNTEMVVKTEKVDYVEDVDTEDLGVFDALDLDGVEAITLSIGGNDISMEVSAFISKANSTTFLSSVGEITFIEGGEIEVTGRIVNFLSEDDFDVVEPGRRLLRRFGTRALNRRLRRGRRTASAGRACVRGRCRVIG